MDHKSDENALGENEERLRLVFDQCAVAMALVSPEMTFLRVNASFCNTLGYSESEIVGQRFVKITHPDDVDMSRAVLHKILEGHVNSLSLEKRYIRKDGSVIWADMSTVVIRDAQQKPVLFVTHIQDITERKRMEDALRHLTETLEKRVKERTDELLLSQKNFDGFFNAVDDLLFVVDMKGVILHVNQTVCRRLGYTEAEIIGQSVSFIHPSARRKEVENIITRMIAGLEDCCSIPVVTKTGVEIPVETHISQGQWNGKPALFGVTKDVTRLQRSEEKFSKAFRSSPVLTAISTIKEGRYIDVNDAFLATLGFSREEVIGRCVKELGLFSDPQDRVAIVDVMDKQGYVRNVQVQYCGKNRKSLWGLFFADHITVSDEPCWLTAMMDVTDRKKAEEALSANNAVLDRNVTKLRKLTLELIQAEERERKRLASKLHDDIQQLLVAAMMKVSLIVQHAAPEDHARAVQNALDLLGEVLNASRSLMTDLYPPVLRAGGFLPGLRWLAERMKEKHGLTVELAVTDSFVVPSPLGIMLFEGVRELLFNVVKHAGVTQVKVTVKKMDANKVKVVVSDGGAGFSPKAEWVPHATGGWGLFHLRERLACIGGVLEVSSAPEKGTKVTMTLPLNESEKSGETIRIL